jgi:putative SbcD/Mre11-related phosphoesterase
VSRKGPGPFFHADWLLTPERVAVHLPTATAVVADLHLGYDRARQQSGEAVPSRDLDDLLRALTALQQEGGLGRLVIAGDLFENATGITLVPDLRRWLKLHHLELVGIVPGNHDRGLKKTDSPWPLLPEGMVLGDWQVVHGEGPLPNRPLVLGHFHPCLRWSGRLVAACYLLQERRIVLPAFSPDAAGVNVLSSDCWRGYRCAAIAGDQVLDFGEVSRLRAMRRPRFGSLFSYGGRS